MCLKNKCETLINNYLWNQWPEYRIVYNSEESNSDQCYYELDCISIKCLNLSLKELNLPLDNGTLEPSFISIAL